MTSSLEIYDLASGETVTVLQTDRLIEAPNWSPDGKFLVVNGDGRLFRVVLDDPPELAPIDTGFAVTCNNDHGISPDGTSIVISDQTDDPASCIYVLPIGGGAPRRVTEKRPSYWHGWSPDGSRLAYCAERGGDWDIYTIGVEGGVETRLTDGKGASDGPDYSPDGSCVLYLAYGNGVEGHPRDHEVELRLMDPDGGNVRTLAAIFGGQGSINVPNWSPDGRRFAFVRYART